MSVLGTFTYVPQAKFSLTRTYVQKVAFGFGPSVGWTQSGGDFYFTDTSNPIVHVRANFNPSFWSVNSNGFTLDYLLNDWYLIIDPDPTPRALNATMIYGYETGTTIPYIYTLIAGWTNLYRFNTPPAPTGYWNAPNT